VIEKLIKVHIFKTIFIRFYNIVDVYIINYQLKQGNNMCVVCSNLSQKDYIESALAVKSTINGESMTIPLTTAVQSFHTIEQIQSLLLNANLIAILF